jgi:hypothetical protein
VVDDMSAFAQAAQQVTRGAAVILDDQQAHANLPS